MDCSLPDGSVHGISQARRLELVAISFSIRKAESESHAVMSDFLRLHGLYSPWNSPGQNTRVGSLSLLQEIFPTQGSNPGLPHCRQIPNQLSHKRSPRILEWVAYPFSRESSEPRNQTGVSCTAGGFFINWATSLWKRSLSCHPFLVTQMVGNPPATQETLVQSLGSEHPLEMEMAT